ncbi:hypothetical protein OHA18_41380 [Kribbella sp. NBC_00709]|uniref:hypothetical protein n=1 Tax=Kribbella sp. NBC_00709 TaxID=2975972 RepID=UPI002E28B81A|nr:hypothetical protein [Kribbella sp. NBC_00709]
MTNAAGVMFIHWFSYLMIAREAHERAVAWREDSPSVVSGDGLVAVVFAALSVEAFINELTEMAARSTSLSPPTENGVMTDLGRTLSEIEDAKGPVELKYQMAFKILSGTTLSPGEQPYQDFKKLVQLRNDLVHLRHRDRTDDAGYVSPMSGVVRDLQQRRITLTRGRMPGDVPGGTSWLDELRSPEIAAWACRAAASIITTLGEMLPDDEDLGIAFVKQQVSQIPDLA